MLAVLLVHGQSDAAGGESHTSAEVLQLSGAGVAGHDDDRVAEVHEAPVAIGESALVEHLQQQVEDIAVGLLYLIEQNDRVGLAAYSLRQLSTLLVAHIARRRTDESADIERLSVLRHVHPDECVSRPEHKLSQLLGQIGLAHAGGPEEHEGADGVVRVFQSHAVALYGAHHLVDGLVLSYDAVLQLLCHALQTYALALSHSLHGHTAHHRHHIGHLCFAHRLSVVAVAIAPLLGEHGQLSL